MNLQRVLVLMAILMLTVGCQDPAETASSDAPAAPAQDGSPAEVAHTHEPGDELVWESKEKIDDIGIELWLGHHGNHFHAGDMIEPSVAIMKDGKAFADASVYNQLVDPNDPTKSITEEVGAVFEPKTEEEIAHYAQADLKIPAGAESCVIRFRIESLEIGSLTRDIKVKVGH